MSYDPERFAMVCERMVSPEPRSLSSVCKDEDMPSYPVVMRWLNENEQARENYARAMRDRSDAIFDEMLDIADTPMEGEIVTQKADGSVETKREDMLGHRRLQIDARKWILGRMNPAKYGDKIEIKSTGRSANMEIPESMDAQEAARRYQVFIAGE